MSQMKDIQQPDRRVSQYETLMRKFSQAHKETCRSVQVDIPMVQRAAKQFPTGSQYTGTWDVLGMSGTGEYTFSNGVKYTGEFDDGMFHGEGELLYPNGEVLKGSFRQGRMVERTLIFADGLYYSNTDWMYCEMPDRRYTIEYEEGLKPAGQSNVTADLPPREIPPGFYDTGDGFYDPESKMVYCADNISAILRSPSIKEQDWIIENCRTNPSEEIGPRPDLYEDWLEPMAEPEPLPLPAAMSRATEYMFEGNTPSSLSLGDDDSSTARLNDYSRWLRRFRQSCSYRSSTKLNRSSTKLIRSTTKLN